MQIRKRKTTTSDSTADRILLLKDLGTDLFNTEGEKKGKQHEYLTADICSLNKSTTRFPVQLNWQVIYAMICDAEEFWYHINFIVTFH